MSLLTAVRKAQKHDGMFDHGLLRALRDDEKRTLPLAPIIARQDETTRPQGIFYPLVISWLTSV